MFHWRPYDSAPIIISGEGAGIHIGRPRAIELCRGMVEIDPRPPGEAALDEDEVTALALTCAGMGQIATGRHLEAWHENAWARNDLYDKLQPTGQRLGEAAVALAFEKQYLVGTKPPRLAELAPRWQRRFFDFAALLGTDLPDGEIGEIMAALGVGSGDFRYLMHSVATTLRLHSTRHPGRPMVALAGASGLLPPISPESTRQAPPPLTPDLEARMFTPHESLTQPFEYNPSIRLEFDIAQAARNIPLPDRDPLREIRFNGGSVVVNPAASPSQPLKPREMTAFTLRAVGLSREKVAKLVELWSKSVGPLVTAYRKLLPGRPSRTNSRGKAPQAIAAAFDSGMFVAVRRPHLPLNISEQERFLAYTRRLAQGRTEDDIAEEFRLTSADVVRRQLRALQDKLWLESRSALVFAAELYRRAPSPPDSTANPAA